MKKLIVCLLLISCMTAPAHAISLFGNRKRQVVIINNTSPANPQKCVEPTGYVGQPVRILYGVSFPFAVRVIKPGDMMTMDYSPNRLNIFLDENDIMREVRCG